MGHLSWGVVGWDLLMSFVGDMTASAFLFLNILTATGIANVSKSLQL